MKPLQAGLKRESGTMHDAARQAPVRSEPVAAVGLVAAPGLHDGDALRPLRRKSADDPLGGSDVPDAVVDELRRRKGGGSPLPSELSAPLSEHFGVDLSPVRIHSDNAAGELARSVQASAFTHGSDIYFAPGAYQPSSSTGQHMLAHELSHVVAQHTGADRGSAGRLTVGHANDPAEADADRSAERAMTALRRTTAVGSTPAAEMAQPGATTEIRRWPSWLKKSKGKATEADTTVSDYPKSVTIGSELIEVASPDEEAEATRIIGELKTKHDIDLSSATTIAAIKKQYTRVPRQVTDQLSTATWTIAELRALSEAATFYAPILGAERDESTLAGSVQGVTTVGKLKNAIDANKAEGELDSTTLGEAFSGSRNLGLFSAGTTYKDKNFVRRGKRKTDVQTSLTATAIHEMAHALIQPTELGNWVAELDYWADRNTASGKKRAEKPPTSYGKTNAAEDLCESVALYMINRTKLKKKCPLREAFIAKVIASWKPAIVKDVVDTAAESSGTEKPPATPVPAPVQGGEGS